MKKSDKKNISKKTAFDRLIKKIICQKRLFQSDWIKNLFGRDCHESNLENHLENLGVDPTCQTVTRD